MHGKNTLPKELILIGKMLVWEVMLKNSLSSMVSTDSIRRRINGLDTKPGTAPGFYSTNVLDQRSKTDCLTQCLEKQMVNLAKGMGIKTIEV